MKVREYLAIPYMIEAAPVEREDGEWMRQLRYPELGAFCVQAVDIETALRELETWRVREIVRRLKSNTPPPVPRPPLHNADPEQQVRSLGLWELVGPIFHLEASEAAQAR